MAPTTTSSGQPGRPAQPRRPGRPAQAVSPQGSTPLDAGEVARLSDEEIVSLAEEAFALRSRQDALLCLLGGELDRRQGWRDSGATSLVAWLEQRFGLSAASARTYAVLGEHLIDL